MKIQLQSRHYYPLIGGIENYLYYTSKALLTIGHEPMILCSQHQPSLKTKEFTEGIKIIRHPAYLLPLFPFAPINPIYYVTKLQKYLANNPGNYDVIWSRFFYEAYASGKVFHGKIPIIFIPGTIVNTTNKIESSHFYLMRKIYAKSVYLQFSYIEKKAVEMSNKIVVFSHNMLRQINELYNVSNEKISVIPPGVELDTFNPFEKDRNLFNELSLPNSSKIILTVCRLSYQKNLEMLIRAFNNINNRDSYLVFVGDGFARPYLEKMVKKLDLAEKTRFVGIRRDVKRFYSIADVFVLPSMYEPFGQVFLEAMASGVPCIGLRSDYPRVIVASEEIIRDGLTGYCVDPYSEIDLSEKIEKVVSDKKLQRTMGEEARAVCEREYTWDMHVKKLIKLSKAILL